MVSLKDQLASLADLAPQEIDPEDDRIRGSDSDSENEISVDNSGKRDHYVEVGKSSLRSAAEGLDEVKYKGQKVDRKSLYGQSDSESSEGESEGEDDGESDSGDQEDEVDDGSELSLSDSEEPSEDDDEGSEDEAFNANKEDEDAKRAELNKLMAAEQKKIVGHLSSAQRADAEKGSAVQHQMNIYEGALDLRINIQKAVSAANVLPIDASGREQVESEKTEELQSKALEALQGLMSKINDYRVELMINDNIIDTKPKPAKKRNLEQAFGEISQLDDHINKYRDSVLDKWSRKIQSSSGAAALQSNKFKSLNQTAAVQVGAVLADMERLMKRTQVNRSHIKVLGMEQSDKDQNQVDAQEEPYIFDDTDFYRLQLKELVDKRMADNTTSTAGVKWAAVKSKTKKQVDTKASKGRKLRYNVQEKVQGFAAPQPLAFPWSDDQRDDLFSSLFGQSVALYEEESEAESESEQEPELEEPHIVDGGLKLFA